VSDPEEPSEFGYFDDKVGSITSIVSDGDMAFTFYQNYLRIVDTSDPQNPCISKFETNLRNISMIYSCDHVLYIACRDSASQDYIKVFDILDDDIRERVSIGLYDQARKILNTDHYLFVFKGDSIIVIDVQDPDIPLNVGSVPRGDIRSGTIAGDNLYLISNSGDLLICTILAMC